MDSLELVLDLVVVPLRDRRQVERETRRSLGISTNTDVQDTGNTGRHCIGTG